MEIVPIIGTIVVFTLLLLKMSYGKIESNIGSDFIYTWNQYEVFIVFRVNTICVIPVILFLVCVTEQHRLILSHHH